MTNHELKVTNLKKVAQYCQQQDKNGVYLINLENDLLGVDDAIDDYIELLENWINENLTETDVEEIQEIQYYINLLQYEYITAKKLHSMSHAYDKYSQI